jgi:hypothetical protein
VASLQDDSVGVVTALSPATVGHFKFYLLSSIVGLGLRVQNVQAVQDVQAVGIKFKQFERLEPFERFDPRLFCKR